MERETEEGEAVFDFLKFLFEHAEDGGATNHGIGFREERCAKLREGGRFVFAFAQDAFLHRGSSDSGELACEGFF